MSVWKKDYKEQKHLTIVQFRGLTHFVALHSWLKRSSFSIITILSQKDIELKDFLLSSLGDVCLENTGSALC